MTKLIHVIWAVSPDLASSEPLCNWRSSAPSKESPQRRLWSRKVKGLFLASVISQSESFGHFDGHGVFVDSVEAAFTDQTAGNGEPLFTVDGYQFFWWRVLGELAFWCDLRFWRVVVEFTLPVQFAFDVLPGLDEFFGEVTAGLDEEGSRTHGHVADTQVENFRGGAQLPLVTRPAFGGSEVDEGVKGVLDDGFGEAACGVVRAR